MHPEAGEGRVSLVGEENYSLMIPVVIISFSLLLIGVGNATIVRITSYNVCYTKLLRKKTKELIAFAVAHAIQCPYCIDVHAKGSSSAGATREEMAEAIHVAAVILV